jgi:nitroreductase
MEFMDVLAGRRSVRSYTSERLERAEIEGLIRAAVLAPSGMNSQPWAFAVIEGAQRLCALSVRVKANLLATLDREPALARYRDRLSDPAFNVFYDAPALVLVCAKPFGYDPTGACAMAAHALMLAARDRGLGTCWIGFAEGLFQLPDTKAEFGIPPAYRVVAPIIVGHPAEAVAPTPRDAPEVVWL